MPTNPSAPGGTEDLVIRHLSDALGLALDLRETFAGEFCALWLGDAAMRTVDFIVLTDHLGGYVDRLAPYAVMAGALDASIVNAVMWHTAHDLDEVELLALDFFEQRDMLERAGIALLDEIAIGSDEFRTLAIATFTDAPEWDDVSHVLEMLSTDDD